MTEVCYNINGRKNKIMTSSSFLTYICNNFIVFTGSELVGTDDDGEHQTLRDISRCAPREISYETSQCEVQPQHCNMQQQHCSVQPQHCDVQLSLPNRRISF